MRLLLTLVSAGAERDVAMDVGVDTPVGALTEQDGALTGCATGKDETVALQGIVVDGQRITWSQSVRKPMRLNLDFDVTVDGDRLVGHSRAGRLPRSAVTGARRR